MDYQIFLTTGTPDRRFGEPQTDYYAHTVDYFEVALRTQGLRAPVRIPSEEKDHLGAAIRGLADEIIRRLDPGKMNIVGLTHRNGRSFACVEIARRLRLEAQRLRAPLMVIGGGPHFARESLKRNGRLMPDSVSNALLKTRSGDPSPLYDAVIAGGFGAFVDLVRAVDRDEVAECGGILRPTGSVPRGYYYMDRSTLQIVGTGRSGVPPLETVPISLLEIPERGGCSLIAIFSNACMHGCDFCSLPKYVRFSKEQVVEGIREAVHRYGEEKVRNALHLTLWDPTPLSALNRERTFEYLTTVWSELGRHVPPEICLCGPYEVLIKPDQLVRDIEELNPIRLTIGRDAIGEPGASFMGCKQRGRLKPAEWLRQEREGLDEIIRHFQKTRRRIRLELSYIISPVETVESLNALFDEMGSLCGLSDGTLEVTADWSFLYPPPGTSLLRDQLDLVSDLVYDTSHHLGSWERELLLERYPDSCLPDMERIFGTSITGGVYCRDHHEQIRQLRSGRSGYVPAPNSTSRNSTQGTPFSTAEIQTE